MTKRGLDTVYNLKSAGDSKAFYDGWAEGYEAELAEHGYVTPARAAEALAAHAASPWAPLAEFGCGTGLGGLALAAQGFECIDGFDISEEMLNRAEAKGIYRALAALDMSQPLQDLPTDIYQNAAAIGVFNPSFMPASVLDEILALIPSGGCFVFTLNDHALAERSFEARLMDLVEHNVADLLVKEHGAHLPGIGLDSTVYLLRKP
ncbi:MAG: methyltransferase domain-containing protein [Pseudomonadota bacterium]